MTPLIAAIACAILLIFTSLLVRNKNTVSGIAIFLFSALLAANIYQLVAMRSADVSSLSYFGGQLRYGIFAVWFNTVMAALALYYAVLNRKSIEQVGIYVAEYYSLLFFIMTGISLISGFGSLLILFLGIEILSIPQYILAGSDKNSLKSSEASLKYFLMGAFSTGILLMGIALLYGSMGSFNISDFVFDLKAPMGVMSLIGVFFVAIALGFKASAAPMHWWTPDVYDGTPTTFTSFIATIVKVGIFIAFIRLFSEGFGTIYNGWYIFIAVITGLTLLIGNIAAVYQQSVKRMLAYSSIAQAGFMLFAILAINAAGLQGILIYAFAYSIATIGLFAILLKMKDYTYDGFNGLAKKEPFIAVLAAIFLFSLSGIPLTAGFFAKFFVLRAALQQNPAILPLIIFALVMAGVGVYYYFKLIMAIYFKKGEAEMITPFTLEDKLLLTLGAVALIVVGAVPDVLSLVFG